MEIQVHFVTYEVGEIFANLCRQGRKYQNKHSGVFATKLKQIDYMTVTTLDKDYADIIKQLWQDRGVRDCFEHRNEFQVLKFHHLNNYMITL